ncbi:hypothetical protein BDV59DRAFT_131495 [Aspergillus ambiguus]|uniref:uncharacterized protein n=1 Tax=Aspergillus ambiguus TaxID=176160 RepID=UPI003CCE0AD9
MMCLIRRGLSLSLSLERRGRPERNGVPSSVSKPGGSTIFPFEQRNLRDLHNTTYSVPDELRYADAGASLRHKVGLSSSSVRASSISILWRSSRCGSPNRYGILVLRCLTRLLPVREGRIWGAYQNSRKLFSDHDHQPNAMGLIFPQVISVRLKSLAG